MRTTRGAWQSTQEAAALAAILTDYWIAVFPGVRRELASWRACAAAIPDPHRRALALSTLEGEGGLAEGAAIFATLVHGRVARRELIRLLVAWQVAYDYLDTLGEQIPALSADRGAQLYSILGVALSPGAAYGGHAGDGGYLDRAPARFCCRAPA